MILFSFPRYEYLASKVRKLPGWRRGRFSVNRYQNQELFVQVKIPVRGEVCAILAETAPPDANLLSLLLLAHTLKKEGARKIVALIPYLGYARHDRQEPGQDLATEWLGESLKNAGVSEVVTVDAHSAFDADLFPIPLHSLSPAGILARAIPLATQGAITLVAPDEGAVDNCESVRNVLGKDIATASFQKKRTTARVALSRPQGKVEGCAVIVDDMLDTGETLLRCVEKLRATGVRKSIVFVTHGLFSGNEWRKLFALGVEHIYCTDTIPQSMPATKKVTVLGIASVLVEYLRHASYE